jgi:hypothetical protein
MPEHVHVLITEPERAKLSLALALPMLKQNVSRQLREPEKWVVLAVSILRFQCLDRGQADREAALHSA